MPVNDDLAEKTTRVTTRDNTTQHMYSRRQFDTTRHNTSTTRRNTSTTQHNTRQLNTTRDNASTTRSNRSTKEARVAKLGLYFALFVTELYVFLISFRNK